MSAGAAHAPVFFEQAMNIIVKLFASFRTGRFGEQQRSCEAGYTAGQMLAELGIAEAEVGVMLVNGKHITPVEALSDGDTLSVFPLLGGG
jgi:sulfur-carrier protein